MIIENIHIDGFGMYHNYALPLPLKKGVNIIYGENEAGKSTLLHFIRYTLFGYPTSRKAPKMTPLEGGKHGGRVIAVSSGGEQIVFERHAATRQGKIHLLYKNREYQDEMIWFRLLGNANDKLFNNIYAFTLDELIGYGSLNDSGMQDRLFSIGMGLNTASVQQIEDKIKSSMEDLYVERGRTKKINELLEQLSDKQRQLAGLRGHMPLFEALSEEILRLEGRIKALGSSIQKIRPELEKKTNLLKCYPHYLKLQQIEDAMSGLPEIINFPDQWKDDLTKAEERLRKNLEDKDELELNIERLQEQYEALNPDNRLIEGKSKILKLKDDLNLYTRQLDDHRSLQEKYNSLNNHIQEKVRQLSTGLTTGEIKQINTKAVVSQIKSFIKQREGIEDRKKRAEARRDAAYGQLSSVRIQWIFIVFGILFWLGAGALYYYHFPVGSGIAALAGLALIIAGPFLKSDKKLKIFSEQLAETAAELQDLDERISSYLREHLKTETGGGLLEALSTVSAIEQVQDKISQAGQLGEQIEGLKRNIGVYEDEVKRFVSDLNRELPGEQAEVSVRILVEMLEQEEGKHNKKQSLHEEMSRLTAELKSIERRSGYLRKEIADIFSGAGVDSREAFILRYEQNKKTEELTREKSANLMAIDAIFGAGKSGVVIQELKTMDKPGLEDQRLRLRGELDALEEEEKLLLDQLGGKKRERENLLNTEEMAKLATETESLKENLKILRRDWLSYHTALDLLYSVKGKYEREKQPEVIGKAGAHFKNITNGRYPELKVPFGKQEISIVDRHQKLRTIGALSRGTREQLLLALRLAFIETYEKDAEPLPIVMDEVLVNFDRKRAGNLARILADFAGKRQILLFTCHRHTADLFSGEKVNLVTLS